jgi:hypothetical protein
LPKASENQNAGNQRFASLHLPSFVNAVAFIHNTPTRFKLQKTAFPTRNKNCGWRMAD